jgi:hypothetical protein
MSMRIMTLVWEKSNHKGSELLLMLGLFAQRPQKGHFTGCMVFNWLIGICLRA